MKKLKILSQTENSLIENAIENYLDSCEIRGLSPRTTKNYQKTLDVFFAYLKSKNIIYLNDLNIQVIENYIKFRQEAGLKDTTINFDIRNIRTFVIWCEERELVNHIKIREIKIDAPIKETYTQEELKILLRKPSKPKNF